MILSHKHHLIFSRPRKVASTSFEMALSRFYGVQDVITPLSPSEDATRRADGFLGPQKYSKPLAQSGAARQSREAFFAPYPELRDAIGALCQFEIQTLGYEFKDG